MHENNRITLAFVEIGNFDSAVVKTRHHQFHLWGIGMGDLAITASLEALPLQWNWNGRDLNFDLTRFLERELVSTSLENALA